MKIRGTLNYQCQNVPRGVEPAANEGLGLGCDLPKTVKPLMSIFMKTLKINLYNLTIQTVT